jgi:hypothetical protein
VKLATWTITPSKYVRPGVAALLTLLDRTSGERHQGLASDGAEG